VRLIALFLLLLCLFPVLQVKSENEWLEYAAVAWSYFQPGVGVSPNTGLNYATSTYHYITDWDLGCYISAIIDAEKLGLIQRNGDWGADYRISRIISFLKNRELTSSGLPYWFYNSDTGQPDVSRGQGNPSDSGRLLVALYRLKQHRPDLADDIDYIISRTNYAKFAENCPTDGFYAYYYAHGYSLFGLNTSRVQMALNFLNRIPSMRHVQVYSQSLPVTEIIMEPILHAMFELETTPEFNEWAYRIYRVQEDRYAETGKLTAFTEGAYRSPSYIYEWIVHPYGNVWYITTPKWEPISIQPVVYTKAAFGMHAIWPSSYTEKLVEYVSEARTPWGFYEGVDENGQVIPILTDKTNSLIINAARYAMERAKKVGYTLKVKVLDWRMKTAIANATVYLNGEAKKSDADGYAEWRNLTGTVTIRVSYLGVWVSDSMNVEVNANKTVEVQCRLYDVYVQAVTPAGSPLSDIKFMFSLNGTVLGSAVTNQTGYAYFKDLPASDLMLTAYGSDSTEKLGEWSVKVNEDGQIVVKCIMERNGRVKGWCVLRGFGFRTCILPV